MFLVTRYSPKVTEEEATRQVGPHPAAVVAPQLFETEDQILYPEPGPYAIWESGKEQDEDWDVPKVLLFRGVVVHEPPPPVEQEVRPATPEDFAGPTE